MPRYCYECKECGESYEIFHNMGEVKSDCEICGKEESLIKIPALFTLDVKGKNESSAKQRVEQFISEAKEELQQHRIESREEYKD